jgi:iron complex outermembrane receptor protein/outer membrane receptor for ferrienterochelin and colicins
MFASKKMNRFGYVFFGGITSQNAKDVNKDGFSDVPKTNSLVLHPKIFFYPSESSVISLGWTGSFDKNNWR